MRQLAQNLDECWLEADFLFCLAQGCGDGINIKIFGFATRKSYLTGVSGQV
jgi:hypothetical protein